MLVETPQNKHGWNVIDAFHILHWLQDMTQLHDQIHRSNVPWTKPLFLLHAVHLLLSLLHQHQHQHKHKHQQHQHKQHQQHGTRSHTGVKLIHHQAQTLHKGEPEEKKDVGDLISAQIHSMGRFLKGE
jgi:hypothetical protein